MRRTAAILAAAILAGCGQSGHAAAPTTAPAGPGPAPLAQLCADWVMCDVTNP